MGNLLQNKVPTKPDFLLDSMDQLQFSCASLHWLFALASGARPTIKYISRFLALFCMNISSVKIAFAHHLLRYFVRYVLFYAPLKF